MRREPVALMVVLVAFSVINAQDSAVAPEAVAAAAAAQRRCPNGYTMATRVSDILQLINGNITVANLFVRVLACAAKEHNPCLGPVSPVSTAQRRTCC
jgi:hypothetical protein